MQSSIKNFLAWGAKEAKHPRKGSLFSTCHDLPFSEEHILQPGESKTIDTKINCRLYPWHGEIKPRSCLAGKKIDIFNGIIDGDFDSHETIKVTVTNNNPDKAFRIPKDVPIAQLLVTSHVSLPILWYGQNVPPEEHFHDDQRMFGSNDHKGFGSTNPDECDLGLLDMDEYFKLLDVKEKILELEEDLDMPDLVSLDDERGKPDQKDSICGFDHVKVKPTDTVSDKEFTSLTIEIGHNSDKNSKQSFAKRAIKT